MNEQYLTVTALTKYIKRKLDTDPHLRHVWLKGEISNFKFHHKRHMYMTIKDDQTRIQAVMFAGNNRFLKFMPEDGMQVLIQGEVSLFEAAGQYQLYIQKMEPDGLGSLYLAYEQLKNKLQEKGYFSADYKRPLPLFPKHIGVVTSPTGAAVRDIITTLKRRYPIVDITIIPVLVQGPLAAESIKRAIEIANKRNIFDVLIVGRGGGSIEELWSFNEEIVAEAVFHSQIPIISAVGHETDTTICDYVADLRAPTPTGAAELAVPSRQELLEKVYTLKRMLTRVINSQIQHHQKTLDHLKTSYAFRYPRQLLRQKEQELDQLVEKIIKTMNHHVTMKQQLLSYVYNRLCSQHPQKQFHESVREFTQLVKRKDQIMADVLQQKADQLLLQMEKLTLLNPLETMKRGFAIAYTETGEIIKTAKQVKQNEQITVHITDAKLNCEVLYVEENES